MPTIEQTIDEVLNMAAKHFNVPREGLSPDDDFFKKLGINSLQALDLLTKLESHFRIELPDGLRADRFISGNQHLGLGDLSLQRAQLPFAVTQIGGQREHHEGGSPVNEEGGADNLDIRQTALHPEVRVPA